MPVTFLGMFSGISVVCGLCLCQQHLTICPLELLLHLLVQRLSTGFSHGSFGGLQVLLRTLRFDLIAEQPLRYLLNFCRLLHCSHAVSKLAVCLACPLVIRPQTCTLCIHMHAVYTHARCVYTQMSVCLPVSHSVPF